MSWFAIKHQLFDFLRLIGMRDRLRCPICRKVGTYKPHGGWLDFDDKPGIGRRWMCKWCGSMKTLTGWQEVHPGTQVWEHGAGLTPQRCIAASFRYPVDPWRG